jgi:hypothetical protein
LSRVYTAGDVTLLAIPELSAMAMIFVIVVKMWIELSFGAMYRIKA